MFKLPGSGRKTSLLVEISMIVIGINVALWLMMNRYNIATMRVTDPTLLQDQMFKTFFVYSRQDIDNMVALYRLTSSESEEPLKLIEVELGDS